MHTLTKAHTLPPSYICIHTHTYAHALSSTCLSIVTFLHTYIFKHIHTHTHIHTCSLKYLSLDCYVSTYIYIHAHTYIHTHIHTWSQIKTCLSIVPSTLPYSTPLPSLLVVVFLPSRPCRSGERQSMHPSIGPQRDTLHPVWGWNGRF